MVELYTMLFCVSMDRWPPRPEQLSGASPGGARMVSAICGSCTFEKPGYYGLLLVSPSFMAMSSVKFAKIIYNLEQV